MLIPFCSKIKVAGRGLHKVLAENTTRRRGDFPDKPSGIGPWESHKPRTTFADKKGTASVSLTSHKVEIWKEAKVQSRNNEEKSMWLLPVITGYDLY